MTSLEARSRILRAVRGYFESQGFLEVETPLRVRAPGQELHLDAIATDGSRWLITSPEYHMKRLVAAGHRRIYQIARCFRAAERGPHHQPEFTMLEWYRAEEPLEAIAADCEALLSVAARAVGTHPSLPVPPARSAWGPRIDLGSPAERTTVRALLSEHAGIELDGRESARELIEKARSAGVDPGAATEYDDVFFQIFLDRIEPRLGRGRPTFVFDWPLPLAALARRKPGEPDLAERFELYAGGLELANAFGELVDPVEQRARFLAESATRQERGKAVYPIDERLLEALGRMPPTSGVALGLDRLVMLVLGAGDIRDVLAFPEEEV